MAGYPSQPGTALRPIAVYVGGSTLTSTIPGLSIAGPSPEGTLYTPTLDLEYLTLGLPRTMNVIPMTPDGLPTPALITRAALELIKVPYLVVDAGTYYGIKAPHVRLPSARHGGNIAEGPAMPRGTARSLFEEARTLGRLISRGHDLVLIGETIPGGTTVAAAIMSAAGLDGVSYVSSASPDNPKDLKRQVVSKALSRVSEGSDIFSIVDAVGDPVHVTMAGVALGAMEEGAMAVLAGGTQMGAVLAILKGVGADTSKVSLWTTKWILNDETSNIRAIAEAFDVRDLEGSEVDFSDSPFEGLRMFERGFVKEGVGAGGTMVLAAKMGFDANSVKSAIYSEYKRLRNLGSA
ncbi:nicotinate-nucleotide-dimethylbenzimidazole phosphoribosyltransferase [Acidilobus saccharovorans 345-15]|uniref:UPF0284 protein ASAC_0141 n=1 Tax=Acidilobus saccharovorans (strain DSM 16705 / JCM 18335 / VKM B-2471 / 345-15) TaxID=666510 RepID=D9PZR1_ACIS3|nr:nicotinate-nucleotide-dimethylbenzimidazole phosphoribosyltransferase [Acidilobus saccharovorans 345-15]